MKDDFIRFIKKHDLFYPHERILLAVSGGIDSTVLSELFHVAGFDFVLAHCNFKLRGKESDGDQLFAEELAEKYKVPFFISIFQTKKYAVKKGISVQMAARELRYEWFEKIRKESGCQYIATAHNLDDQIETVFVNLTRVTGIAGMHGIKPRQGNIIRPLLFAYRRDIKAYADKNGIIFREDSSNKSDHYTRNFIRHKIIPLFEKINPEFRNTFTQTIGQISKTEEIYRRHIQDIKKQLMVESDNVIKLNIEELKKLQPPDTYLYEFLKSYGFNYSQIEELINSLGTIPGKQFISENYILTKDRKELIITPKITINEFNYFIEKSDKSITIPVHLHLSSEKKTEKLNILTNQTIAMLDYDKLTFPLTLRKWQQGDFFYPLGMNLRKKLSDFFTDHKFSIPEKQNIWLLCSGKDIIWIVGHRIDDRYKVTEVTKTVFTLKLINL